MNAELWALAVIAYVCLASGALAGLGRRHKADHWADWLVLSLFAAVWPAVLLVRLGVRIGED